MTDFEIHLSLEGGTRLIGRARCNRARGKETVHFEYDDGWLLEPERFALEPGLPLTRGGFQPPAGQAMHGSLGDSAPDTWGRRLMQRAERRQAEREGRAVRTLIDHLRNHGFLRRSKLGWVLSPAYDLNPVPVDLKARVLTTNIDLEEGTCSIGLLESAAGYFALSLADARKILRQVADATAEWREVARAVGVAPRGDRSHGQRL